MHRARIALLSALLLGIVHLPAGARPTAALTDDSGRLRFVVRDIESDTPVDHAVIFLDDPTGTEFRHVLYTAADGNVTTGPLAPHSWRFTVLHPRYKKAIGQVPVHSQTTLTVAFTEGRTTAP